MLGLIYGSYKAPRELVWVFGMTIYLALMAEAFWDMSCPGDKCLTGALKSLYLCLDNSCCGRHLVQWIRGDYLYRNYPIASSLHVVALPIVLIGSVAMHIIALHDVGSNNPDSKYKESL